MKLKELSKLGTYEVIWEDTIEGSNFGLYATTIEEGIKQISFGDRKGGLVKTAGEVLSKINPTLADIAAGLAINSLIKYNKNKKYTTKFFAKDRSERRFYDKLVKDLMKTGHYVKIREKYSAGGYIWILRRKNLR